MIAFSLTLRIKLALHQVNPERIEHIDFMWYLRKVAPWALLGYFAGVLVYLLQAKITGVI